MIRVLLIFILIFLIKNALANDKHITIASTTSTHDTGLLEYINKEFEKKYKIKVRALSLGTGQAIKVAMDGNVEILLVHHKKSELEFMNNGYGALRYDLMYNDFVLIGPKKDNETCSSIENKMIEIKKSKLLFVSRGDESGTHKKEKELWELSNIKIPFKENWYLSVGQGMGSTLLIANQKKAYTLSDRSTWIAFNKKENLQIVCENLPPLFNQYGIILVSNKINNNLNIEEAKKYIDWITSEEAKKLINNYRVNGKQLFFFNHN
jgi:tungstate transport system substrate-binding protein